MPHSGTAHSTFLLDHLAVKALINPPANPGPNANLLQQCCKSKWAKNLVFSCFSLKFKFFWFSLHKKLLRIFFKVESKCNIVCSYVAPKLRYAPD
ncbi:hypothetical protein GDO81_015858 [Engystomops pustulosus]|uniref:Uncharacterized protein n=1 Tax=Engystomops pustulosus TaxID=76066 RepID=A0AAV7ANZ2_ENGPU|nr:hypothetical protein GDO81_015858 [Engystomops pustulosus]